MDFAEFHSTYAFNSSIFMQYLECVQFLCISIPIFGFLLVFILYIIGVF